jgi:hypothetical protein
MHASGLGLVSQVLYKFAEVLSQQTVSQILAGRWYCCSKKIEKRFY